MTDSLLLDHLTGYSKKLIDFFLNHENAVLELKTKTVNIQNLLKFSPNRKIIISWSLNPASKIKTDEKNAPDLLSRLAAAKECVNKGYVTGFHFDPIFYYKGWEEDYKNVVENIFKFIDPKDIAWISLGTLRYPGHMDALFRKNNPESEIFLAEMFPGIDGKHRYLRVIRQSIYKKMLEWIRSFAPKVLVYLCMESHEVWNSVFGADFFKHKNLSKMMDEAILKINN